MGDLYQRGTIGIHQRKAHKLLVCRQAAEPLSRPPRSHPPTTSESPLPSSLLASPHTAHTPSLTPPLTPFPPLTPPLLSRFVWLLLLLFLCAEALMSAQACCHRPPVRSSARHHWTELCQTGPGSTLLRRRREPSGEAGSGTGGVDPALRSLLSLHRFSWRRLSAWTGRSDAASPSGRLSVHTSTRSLTQCPVSVDQYTHC